MYVCVVTYSEHLSSQTYRLIQTLAPAGEVARSLSGGDNKRTKQNNIQQFLDSCRTFGLSDDELFEVEDLLSMQDIPRVTKCLFNLGKLVISKVVGSLRATTFLISCFVLSCFVCV